MLPSFCKHPARLLAQRTCNLGATNSTAAEHCPPDSKEHAPGVEEGAEISYWLSFDADQRTVKYGKGHHMAATTLLSFKCAGLQASGTCGACGPLSLLFGGNSDTAVRLHGCGDEFQRDLATLTLSRRPVRRDPPPLVRDSTSATLADLAASQFLFSSELPRDGQVMYSNLSQPSVELEPALRHAISHSLSTPGALLHKHLRTKMSRFDSGLEMTYLRITVGDNSSGTSPGSSPYVLEVWPSHHASPVHNHGSSFIVMKGAIRVRIFNKHMGATCQPLEELTLREGDVSWACSNYFQTHQLLNDTDEFCATIQGFRYGEEDTVHSPHFEFLNASGAVHEFSPSDSDFTFDEFRRLLLAEHAAA